MQEVFKRGEHVIIGICTPTICTDEEAERTGYPCAPHMNPFTHQERVDMITLALTDVGIQKEQFSFISFPSDYKNIETLLAKDSVFFMSVTSEHDQKKITYLESKGFHIETIFALPENSPRESGNAIREKMEGWEKMVPKVVKDYLKNNPRS